MRVFVIMYLIHFTTCCWGQLNDYNRVWISGYNSFTGDSIFGGTVFEFSADSVKYYRKDIPMNFEESCAFISDTNGLLQFYSNGMYVANMMHDTMKNGSGLNPGWPADLWTAQGIGYGFLDEMLVLPEVDDPKKFWIYHFSVSDEEISTNALFPNVILKTKVDMNGDNGMGEIVEKNVVVYQNDENRLGQRHFDATRHANGRDWWVVKLEEATGELVLHLITPDTVIRRPNGVPSTKFTAGLGQCSFSPNGEKFASGHIRFKNEIYHSSLNYYEFDRCTGQYTQIFHEERDDYGQVIDGVAFSASGRYLYEFYQNYVFRYDTDSSDILGSKDTIAEWDGFTYYLPGGFGFPVSFGYGELGYDGNIYITSSSTTPYIHIITNADDATKTKVIEHVDIPTIIDHTVPNYPNYRLGPLEGSPCAQMFGPPMAEFDKNLNGLEVKFDDQSTGVPLTWHWDFGDGFTSDEQHPEHHYGSMGNYEVCLTVGNVYGEDSRCKELDLTTSIWDPANGRDLFIRIEPNPVTGRMTVKTPDRGGNLRLYDSTGRLEGEWRLVEGMVEIQTGNLPAGMFFVKYTANSGEILWSRVVISH